MTTSAGTKSLYTQISVPVNTIYQPTNDHICNENKRGITGITHFAKFPCSITMQIGTSLKA
jgi:hypothetical protein